MDERALLLWISTINLSPLQGKPYRKEASEGLSKGIDIRSRSVLAPRWFSLLRQQAPLTPPLPSTSVSSLQPDLSSPECAPTHSLSHIVPGKSSALLKAPESLEGLSCRGHP